MLTVGTEISERYSVSQAPERLAVGARCEVRDAETGSTHTAVIAALSADGWSVSLADSELRALRAIPTASLALPEAVVAAPGGPVLEVLARSSLDDAQDYAVGLSVQQSPSRVVGMLASRLADVGSDLATLHARGEVHGAIGPHAMLVDPREGGRLVLALCSRARLVQPQPAMPPDAASDTRALAETFSALVLASHAPVDPNLLADVQALSDPPADGPPRTMLALVDALRALASRVGISPLPAPSSFSAHEPDAHYPGPSASQGFATATNSGPTAYRPPPPGSDPFTMPGPKVYLPVRPDEGTSWRFGARAIGLVIGILLAVIRVATRTSHPYGGHYYSPRHYGAYDPLSERYGSRRTSPYQDSSRCDGEPTSPVASVSVPGNGEIVQLATECGDGMIRVAVQRGSDLYLGVRGNSPGMRWASMERTDRVASNVGETSDLAPSSLEASFVVYTTAAHDALGLVPLSDGAHPTTVALPNETADSPPFALGRTEDFTYVAARLVPAGRRTGTLVLLRIAVPDVSDEATDESEPAAPTMTLFDLGNYFPKAVIADTAQPRLLVAEFDASRPGRLRMLTLDLAAFDGVTLRTRARGHVRAPARSVTLSAPLQLPHSLAFAARRGEPTDNTFLVASSDPTMAPAETCPGRMVDGLCIDVRDVSLAYFPEEGVPSLGPTLAARGLPVAVWEGTSGGEALLSGSTTSEPGVSRALRYHLDRDHALVSQGGFTMPQGIPPIDGFAHIHCGGREWMVFAGTSDGDARVTAVPAMCTSIGATLGATDATDATSTTAAP